MNWAQISEYLQTLSVGTIAIRLALAFVCAGIPGVERQHKLRPAGLRTHILVGLGAALAMMIPQFLLTQGVSTDATRMGAQVISGIGFLGAGTILVSRSGRRQVTGLTTAASLWTSACMGLAIGCGFYAGALLTCLFMMVAMIVLAKLGRAIKRGARYTELQLCLSDASALRAVLAALEAEQVSIISLQTEQTSFQGSRALLARIELMCQGKPAGVWLVSTAAGCDGVWQAEEV
ncbi:MAG: MgtC/SapB family protein [Eubacteriales bacterium]